MDLSEFLLARIAEDEAEARLATWERWSAEGVWSDDEQRWCIGVPDQDDAEGRPLIGEAFGPNAVVDAHHIAKWDPTRVLAECEAKRRIVEWHGAWPVLVEQSPQFEQTAADDPSKAVYRMSQQIAWTTEREYRRRFGAEPPTGPVLRFLALPYANHPDFQQEWKP